MFVNGVGIGMEVIQATRKQIRMEQLKEQIVFFVVVRSSMILTVALLLPGVKILQIAATTISAFAFAGQNFNKAGKLHAFV